MFSKKATEIDDLTLCSKGQMDGEDFVNFCGLLRKHELYLKVARLFFQELHSTAYIYTFFKVCTYGT